MAKLTRIQKQKAGLDLQRKANKTQDIANKAMYLHDFYNDLAKKTDWRNSAQDYFYTKRNQYWEKAQNLHKKSSNQSQQAWDVFQAGKAEPWRAGQRMLDLVEAKEVWPHPKATQPKSKKKRGPEQTDAELEAGFGRLK